MKSWIQIKGIIGFQLSQAQLTQALLVQAKIGLQRLLEVIPSGRVESIPVRYIQQLDGVFFGYHK
ncbi:hypothetical protein D3C73_616470 [compost metagenome]